MWGRLQSAILDQYLGIS